jgi:aryl-phospho-beta-D-glucosidase BglC (GH1 family)
MMSPQSPMKVKDSSGLKKWVIGCFLFTPVLCCGGVALFARKWVDIFDNSADLEHQVAEARKHGFPMESKELLGDKRIAESENSYPEIKRLMKDFPNLASMTKAIKDYKPAKGKIIPASIQSFILRSKQIAKYKGYDAHKDYDLGINVLYPEYVCIKEIGRSIALQAEQDAANGKAESAIEDLRLIRNLEVQLSNEHQLLGAIMNLSISQNYYRAISKVIGWLEPDSLSLTKIETLLGEKLPLPNFQNAFNGEFFFALTLARNFEALGGLKAISSGKYKEVKPWDLKRTGLPTGQIQRGMLGAYIQLELKLQNVFESEKNMTKACRKADAITDKIPMTISTSFIHGIGPEWTRFGEVWENQNLSKLMLLQSIDLIRKRKDKQFPGQIPDIPDTVGPVTASSFTPRVQTVKTMADPRTRLTARNRTTSALNTRLLTKVGKTQPMLLSATVALGLAPLQNGVPNSVLQKLSKGANVCRWFRFPDPETQDHFNNYISDSEAKRMRQIGLTHVRLCLAPKYIFDAKQGTVVESFAKQIDASIARFHKAKLLVVIDIHSEERSGEGNPIWEANFVKFWGAYAKRLSKFDPSMTVLEVINEPVYDKIEDKWFALNPKLVSAIRANAPKNTIIATGPNWGGIWGLMKMKPLADRNVVYSFHCYDPFAFTHQGATWAGPDVIPLKGVPYPADSASVTPLMAGLKGHPNSQKMLADYGKENWNKAKMEQNFKQAIDWGRKYSVSLYCGEYGVYPLNSRPEHRANWFRDFGQVLAENKIGWAVWGWDEGFGLNRQMVGGKPIIDTVVAKALGLKP